MHNFGNARAHGVAMRPNLGSFADDGTVDMVDHPTAIPDQTGRVGKEAVGAGALPLRVARREMLADVALAGGTEQRVGDCVEDDVRVAMAGEASVMRDLDSAHHDRPIAGKGMDIEPQAGAGNQAGAEPLFGAGEIADLGDLVQRFIAFDADDTHQGGPGERRIVREAFGCLGSMGI